MGAVRELSFPDYRRRHHEGFQRPRKRLGTLMAGA